MAAMLKALALCAVFMTLAVICSAVLSIYLGIDEYVIWFIFGAVYSDAARKLKL
tara:strand:- start:327 stop:488 length:162 start_codon:yes stop_codon:yes gene_type:complete